MRALAGFLCLSAGLGVGAYTYYPDAVPSLNSFPEWASSGLRVSLARAERSSTGEPSLAAAPASGNGPRVFSPQSPLFTPVIAAEVRPSGTNGPVKTAQPSPVSSVAAPATPTGKSPVATVSSSSGATSPVVTVAENTSPSQPVARPVADWTATVIPGSKGQPGSKPSDPDVRANLVRDIQTQLKRVGCFEGDIDGSWGPTSKRAMSTFTQRINASLPIEEPDYILLTLVAGHRGAACGSTCPTGQAMNEGRCVPSTVVAGAARRARAKDAAAVTATAAAIATKPATEAAAPATATADASKAIAATDGAAKIVEPSGVAKPANQPARDSKPVRTVAEIIADGKSKPEANTPDAKAASRAASDVKRADDAPVKQPRAIAQYDEPKAAPKREPVAVIAETEPLRPRAEPLPGRMTVGGPVPDVAKPREPVTATDTHREAKPRSHAVHAPQAVRAPAPRVVRAPAPRQVAPPPRPRYASAPPSSSSNSGGGAAARQRAMVYNLFQRPDRF